MNVCDFSPFFFLVLSRGLSTRAPVFHRLLHTMKANRYHHFTSFIRRRHHRDIILFYAHQHKTTSCPKPILLVQKPLQGSLKRTPSVQRNAIHLSHLPFGWKIDKCSALRKTHIKSPLKMFVQMDKINTSRCARRLFNLTFFFVICIYIYFLLHSFRFQL